MNSWRGLKTSSKIQITIYILLDLVYNIIIIKVKEYQINS